MKYNHHIHHHTYHHHTYHHNNIAHPAHPLNPIHHRHHRHKSCDTIYVVDSTTNDTTQYIPVVEQESKGLSGGQTLFLCASVVVVIIAICIYHKIHD